MFADIRRMALARGYIEGPSTPRPEKDIESEIDLQTGSKDAASPIAAQGREMI